MGKAEKCFRCDNYGSQNGKSRNGQRYRCTNPECPHPSFDYNEEQGKYHYPHVKNRLFTFEEAKFRFEESKKILDDPIYRGILERNYPNFLKKLEGKTILKSIIRKEELVNRKSDMKRRIEKTNREIERKIKKLAEYQASLTNIDDAIVKLSKSD